MEKDRAGKGARETTRKPYQKPKLEWEEKLEPVAFQITCAKKPLTSPACQAAPQY